MNKMKPLEKDLNDLLNNKILKTKMYSFDEVRDMFKEERQRIREFIRLLKEELGKITFANEDRLYNLIDKLAGEKLLLEEEGK